MHICVRSSFFCPQNMSKANKSKLELISSRNSYTPADIGAFHMKCFKRSKYKNIQNGFRNNVSILTSSFLECFQRVATLYENQYNGLSSSSTGTVE